MSDRKYRLEYFRQKINEYADSGDQSTRDKVQMANDCIDAYEQKFSESEKRRAENLLDELFQKEGALSRHYLITLQAAKDNGLRIYRNQEGKHKVKGD